MKKIVNILKYLLFVLIPLFSVFICMTLKIAQGEKNEEIIFGIILGMILDFIYSILLLFINKKAN